MKLLIVDDDKLVSTSLKTIIESDESMLVCAVGNNGKEAILMYDELKPDILLMDIRMVGMTGIEAADIILKKHSDAKILFLTTFADDEYIVKALKIGVKGYILKQNFESIIPAIKVVYAGQTVFGEDIITKFPSIFSNNDKIDMKIFGITEKEINIIELIADGLSNKEIGAKLYVSEGTVRNNISIILEKLSLRDRTQLAIFYYKNMK